MAKFLVLANLLLFYRSFLDRGACLSRRPGFLFYDWLRHEARKVPRVYLRGWRGGYRENPESEWVGGRC